MKNIFGKKVYILGIGERIAKTTEFDEAYLLSKDSKVFLKLSSNNMFLDAKIMHFVDDLRLKLHLGKQKQYAFLSPK